jgi:hypothetical protein
MMTHQAPRVRAPSVVIASRAGHRTQQRKPCAVTSPAARRRRRLVA